jgi:hypothetical protein
MHTRPQNSPLGRLVPSSEITAFTILENIKEMIATRAGGFILPSKS